MKNRRIWLGRWMLSRRRIFRIFVGYWSTCNAKEPDIEQAIVDETVVRTCVLRGTLHFVAVEDIKWILDLVALRIIASNANLLKTNFKLDNNEFKRIKKVIVNTPEGGDSLTRNKIYIELEKASISTSGLC